MLALIAAALFFVALFKEIPWSAEFLIDLGLLCVSLHFAIGAYIPYPWRRP